MYMYIYIYINLNVVILPTALPLNIQGEQPTQELEDTPVKEQLRSSRSRNIVMR